MWPFDHVAMWPCGLDVEDYKDKVVVGAEWVEAHGGQVVLAPLLEGRSTTGILERAGGDAADGGDERLPLLCCFGTGETIAAEQS